MKQGLLISGMMLLAATSVLAGPPLICHPVEIGSAKSLPWIEKGDNWNSADPRYDTARLTEDTLALLTPSTPLNVRMETMRRAAIYSAKKDGAADQITAQLLARTATAEATAKQDSMAWFDAGYFVETVRQVTFVYRYNMLTPAERTQWKLRGEKLGLDGKPWIERAIKLGGKGMEVALAKIDDYRDADIKRAKTVVATK